MSKKIYIISIVLLIWVGFSYDQIHDLDYTAEKPQNIPKILQEVTPEDIEELKKEKEKINIQTKTLPEKTEKKSVEEKTIIPQKEIKIDTLIYSSNIGNLIKITGFEKDQLKNVTLWDTVLNIKEFQWEVFIEIDPYTIKAGKYDIVFELKNWKRIKYNEKILFWESEQKDLFISNITPNKIDNNTSKKIVLQWQWFNKILSIQLSNNLVLTKANFEIINDNVMSLLIPQWLKTGNYSMNIMSPYWIYKSELWIEVN